MGLSRDERAERFLEEYAELVARHGISVRGCGCCGSPFLGDVRNARSRNGRTTEQELVRQVSHLCRVGFQK